MYAQVHAKKLVKKEKFGVLRFFMGGISETQELKEAESKPKPALGSRFASREEVDMPKVSFFDAISQMNTQKVG